MIEKIRRALIVKYTAVIACILFLGFAASYAAYRHNGIKLLQDSLYDYLEEEIWEAREYFRHGGGSPETHTINSDIQSLHNFTYWLLDGKIIRAEQPGNNVIARQLEQRLLAKTYQPGRIYHENMKTGKQKWYFIVIKQDIRLSASQQGTVFVLANYTPVRKNAKAYIKIALTAAGIIIVLAYLVGSFFCFSFDEIYRAKLPKAKAVCIRRGT